MLAFESFENGGLGGLGICNALESWSSMVCIEFCPSH